MSPSGINLLALLGSAMTVAASPSHAPAAANLCDLVASQLPGLVSYPGQAVYNASQDGYYTSNERDLSPSCVFRPSETAQVSQFVKLVAQNGARDKSGAYKPLFAVRGGGHTLWSGAANMDGGVTVDMRGMSSLAVSPDQKMVSLGAGGKWSDMYPQLVPYNLTIAGGRVPGIGVAGFALGGGVSFQARRHGWSCDNIYGYEVVLASGEVVYVTSDSYPDLWVALKGGSNNFGIVTRFDVAAFPSTQIWGGTVTYNYTPEVLDAQAKAFSNFMDPKNFDDAAMMGVILGFANPGGFSVSNSLFYLEPTPIPRPTRNSPPSLPRATPTPVTNGTNSLGLTAGESDVTMLDFTIAYNNPADDQMVESQLATVVAQQKKAVQDRGLLIPYIYLNYADKSQDPIGSYGGQAKDKLKAASKKYDPTGMFQKALRGGYKVL
ncbi:FAD-binding domain-containing protein [Apiospora hydei]|uniref:FAD-binding domain-containing protein n=1 Tax=Apiospora hydei TaxID=1337664 RepID=A0ABR1VXA1_9PEZI